MSDVLIDTLGFALKGVVVAAVFLIIVAGITSAVQRNRVGGSRIRVRRLNQRFAELSRAVRAEVLGHKKLKQFEKKLAKDKRERTRRVFVLDFIGDIAASGVLSLRNEVSALLGVAEAGDEVVLKLESPGGIVHAYGLAASQLARLREKKLKLTVCVDKVAASGGYMMACLGDEIIAAPFAIIGSIGVVAPVPNAHELLKRLGVDYQEMTAGEFKRTVSLLGEISPEGRKKFQEQLEDTHALFKQFVSSHRPALDIAKVATGEYWFGTRAKELGLVDRLMTSDDYLMSQLDSAEIYHVSYKPPRPWQRRALAAASEELERMLVRVVERFSQARYT